MTVGAVRHFNKFEQNDKFDRISARGKAAEVFFKTANDLLHTDERLLMVIAYERFKGVSFEPTGRFKSASRV